jgi:two-component system cell cycle response regulator DivK
MASLKSKRIFIVEDNPGNLAVLNITLQREGAITLFERRGVDVPQKIARSMPIDLIIMDLMLPGNVSGQDIYENIREQTALAAIPAIVVSANTNASEVERARQNGFKGFIGKPIRLHTFPSYVARLLDGEEIWLPD